MVLYELLVGALPFDPEVLRRAAYAEIQRIIREQEPLRPSARLSNLHDEASVVAYQRQMHLSALMRKLRGDLDWIALKAMAKDRTRRYASASELGADISRHLRTEPVIARPPSLGYRVGKFARKYKAAAIAVGLAVVVSCTASTTLLTERAVKTTVNEAIAQSELVQNIAIRAVGLAISKNPFVPPMSAIVGDESATRVLESGLYAASVVNVAICDMDGNVILAADRSTRACPAGRPVSELASANIFTVLGGTVRSAMTDYVSSEPLIIGGSSVGSVRVRLSRFLVKESILYTLRASIVASILPIIIVTVVAAAASLVVFSREHRTPHRL